MQFLFAVVPKYLNFVTLSKDLLVALCYDFVLPSGDETPLDQPLW
jgi:hypothetical protein